MKTFASDREDAICGSIKEPLVFWLWSTIPPAPDKNRIQDSRFITPVEFEASDGAVLRGYKYVSNDGKYNKTHARGYVLVALGNAMIADQIISDFKAFAAENLDVYIFDYRGYGNSDGKRRINAFIEDYRELTAYLNESYERAMLHGISIGGVVMMNVIGSGAIYDAAVIDSSPSTLSNYGCPKRIDPVSNVPDDSQKLLIITGKKDTVLNEAQTSELRILAESHGARTINDDDFAHPFMDRNFMTHQKRMQLVLDHLLNAGKSD
jgi:alpha/beta superfamily hydrolase